MNQKQNTFWYGKNIYNFNKKALSSPKITPEGPSEVYLCYRGKASCWIGMDYLALRLTILDLRSSRKSPRAFVAGLQKCISLSTQSMHFPLLTSNVQRKYLLHASSCSAVTSKAANI